MADISASNDYFDLGAWNSWNLMNWSNSTINQAALNNYLDSYAQQAKQNGLKQVTLSFAQVADITKMLQGDFSTGSSSDALEMLSKNTANSKVNGQSVLEYIAQRLHADGLSVSLSFGGAVASAKDWDFGFSTNDPATLGKNLADWAKNMGLSSIDFDMETSILGSNNPSDLAKFFSALHAEASKDGISVSLTIMGDASVWGPQSGSNMQALFSQGKSVADMFDGINLMLYNGQYYINAGQTPTQSWDLTNWIDQIKQNTGMSTADAASFIHLGFASAVDYTTPSGSGGPSPIDYSNVPPNIKTNGQYAAYILSQVQDQLRAKYNDPTLTLGSSFFWDNKANYSVDSKNNYQSQFFQNNTFERDFYSSYMK